MPPSPEQAPTPPRRHRWMLPAAVVAALLLGGGFGACSGPGGITGGGA